MPCAVEPNLGCWGVAIALAAGGCGDEPCWGVEKGTVLEVEVNKVIYDSSPPSAPFCAPDQDMTIGTKSRFTVIDTQGIDVEARGCLEQVLEIDDVPSVVRLGGGDATRARGLTGGTSLDGADRVRIGSCEGEWRYSIQPWGDVYAEYDPAREMPKFFRCFFPDIESACESLIDAQLPAFYPDDPVPKDQRCCDRFGVQVRKAR